MKTKILSQTTVTLLGLGLVIFAAAPVQADVGDLVSDDDFTYEVLTENKSSRTGTVSAICFNQESRPEIIIPEVAHCFNFVDGGTAQFTYDVVGLGQGIVAWYDVPVTRFFIPKTIRTISGPPIGNLVEIKGVEVAEDNPWFCSPDGILMDKEQTKLIYYPQGKEGNFYEIPSSIRTIGMNAFTWNETLTEIYVPDTVTNIEFSAFGSCLNLEKIRLSASIKSLADQMFWHCDFLKEVIIPEGVEEIGQGFFGLCMSLNKVEFPASVKSLGEEMFLECTNLEGAYFNGNAPEAENIFAFWDEESTSKAIVYYREGTTGWGPTFCGQPTAVWGDEPQPTADISCEYKDGLLILTFTGNLQESTDTKTWKTLDAASPYTVQTDGTQKFYRAMTEGSGNQNFTIPLSDTVSLDMIWIEPGTFLMGSPEDELGRSDNEIQHEVTLTKGYWMGKYEVTQAQYEVIMGTNPSWQHEVNNPVEQVLWDDAKTFCAKLTTIEKEAGRLPEGYEYNLPTEAQWEYACRAGTTTALNSGKNLTSTTKCPNMDEVGWYGYNSSDIIHPVGQKQPNAWGLYDMHGSVYEWCLDWYEDYPTSPVTDPAGPETGSAYICRGGCWYNYAENCRSARRSRFPSSFTSDSQGFRVALTPVSVESKDMTIPLTEDVSLDMIWIEPGTFVMGSPEDELSRLDNEILHEVTLTKGYWMGKYEVTQTQYEVIMGTNPSWNHGANNPVEQVSWDDAKTFCAKLTTIEKEAGRLPEGYEYNLPTEAQWEYACRAGTTTALNNGKNLSNKAQCPEMDEVGWYAYNGDQTHPVGQKPANAWGLYDMHGNAWEWCLDWYDSGYYAISPKTDPMGPDTGSQRIHRGGSWYDGAESCRSANRAHIAPGYQGATLGFRVALTPVK